MTIYNLEENPDVFIAPASYDNKSGYTMHRFDAKENATRIATIDLKSDKLMIYGCEIEESMLQRFHESVILKNKQGFIYVNCNGACHFWVKGKGHCRPIQNVIFDWSPYGVIVPNSSLDSLNRKLEQKEDEIKEITLKNSSLEAELEASKKQLLTRQHEMGLKLEKVCTQLSLIDFELEIYKIELKSSKNEVNELQHRLSLYMEETEDMEIKLRKVQDELCLCNSTLKSTVTQLELSRKNVLELEEELLISKNENEGMKIKLKNFEDQILSLETKFIEALDEICSSNLELESFKTKLDSSTRIVRELEEELLVCKRETRLTKEELENVKEQVSATDCELESYRKHIRGLKDYILSIDSKVKYTNEKIQELLVFTLWSKVEYKQLNLLTDELEGSTSGIPAVCENPSLMSSIQICSQFEEDICEDLSDHEDLDRTQDK